MDDEITKALYDSYSVEDKGDFFTAYLYLKHLRHMVYSGFQMFGEPMASPPPELDESLSELINTYMNYIGETAPSIETNVYHGKVVKLEEAVELVTQKEDINLPISEKVVPYKMARDVILTNPSSIALGTCPCRQAWPNPCLPPPMEVCLIVGDPYASFVAANNAGYRKCSQQEAVEVLEDCHKKGLVQVAYFKKDIGNRFYAICNCCSCCCGGIKAMNLFGGAIPTVAPSGYVAEVSDECSGCGICADNTCHFHAISMNETEDRAIIDFEKCMGCGVCVDMCPAGAITLRRDPSKGEPLDIEELKQQRQ